MDGWVVHFDAEQATGLIRAGDGNRYAFTRANWKAVGTPSVGNTVDFEIDGINAVDVYLVPTHPPKIVPSPKIHPTPMRSPVPIRSYLSARQGLIFACFSLLSCFLPFVSLPFISLNLFGVVSTVTSLLGLAGGSGSGSGAMLFYFLYMIPALATWLIFMETRAEASAGLRLATGLAGLVGPILLIALPVMSAARGASGFGPAGPGSGFSIVSVIGVGWMLLAGASICLIAVASGWSPFSEATSPEVDQSAVLLATDRTDAAWVGESEVENPIDRAEYVPAASGQTVRSYLRDRQGLIFSALLLLGSLLPLVSISSVSYNLFSAVGLLAPASVGYVSSGGEKFLSAFYYLLYVVPLAAGWLVVREIRAEATSTLRAETGIIGFAGPFVLLLLGKLFAMINLPGDFVYDPISILSYMSIGWVLIIASSVALVAVAGGWSPFGERESTGDEISD